MTAVWERWDQIGWIPTPNKNGHPRGNLYDVFKRYLILHIDDTSNLMGYYIGTTKEKRLLSEFKEGF